MTDGMTDEEKRRDQLLAAPNATEEDAAPRARLELDAAPSWLEDSLYRGGKINAVVAVVAVIILGIGLWMFTMDRKLRRLEKMHKPTDPAQGQ